MRGKNGFHVVLSPKWRAPCLACICMMAAPSPPFLVLSPALQKYAWGKKGHKSEACRLKACGDPDFQVDDTQTYAELWMGTHKKGPSVIRYPPSLAGTLLSDWLKDNQWALGDKVAREFDGSLPFLLKILSVNQALSIQAHPDKQRATELHALAPDKYPDPNHKPELVVVLREFQGLCGFRPFPDVQSWVNEVPELQRVLGQQVTEAVIGLPKDAPPCDSMKMMKLAFSTLMGADPVLVREQLGALLERVGTTEEPWAQSTHREENLVCLLNGLHPGDVGCFCVFFLNIVEMSGGHSIFLPPNEPHCYLSGDLVECMACSDNVVRAGLTKKFKDKDTLCDMLGYESKTFEQFQILPFKEIGNVYSEIYDPPTPEYAVARVTVPHDVREFHLPAVNGPSLLLVVEGNANMTVGGITYNTTRGVVIFIAACLKIDFVRVDSQDILMYRAYCDL